MKYQKIVLALLLLFGGFSVVATTGEEPVRQEKPTAVAPTVQSELVDSDQETTVSIEADFAGGSCDATGSVFAVEDPFLRRAGGGSCPPCSIYQGKSCSPNFSRSDLCEPEGLPGFCARCICLSGSWQCP